MKFVYLITIKEVFLLVDDFELEQLFEDRTYERHQFKFKIDGNEYKGNFHDGDIQWLNPHPQQVVGEAKLKAVETQVHALLGEHGVKDEAENIEVEKLFTDRKHEAHEFKLKIQGEEYKGLFRDDQIEWFYPKPQQKVKEEHVEKVEEKVQEKIKEYIEEE